MDTTHSTADSLYFPLLQVLMSLLRLGFITIFLSDALVSGYTAAAAFTIMVTQIKFIFGLDGEDAAVEPGLATTPRVSKPLSLYICPNTLTSKKFLIYGTMYMVSASVSCFIVGGNLKELTLSHPMTPYGVIMDMVSP